MEEKFLFNVKKFERLSNDSNVSPGMFLAHVFLCFQRLVANSWSTRELKSNFSVSVAQRTSFMTIPIKQPV